MGLYDEVVETRLALEKVPGCPMLEKSDMERLWVIEWSGAAENHPPYAKQVEILYERDMRNMANNTTHSAPHLLARMLLQSILSLAPREFSFGYVDLRAKECCIAFQ